MIDAKPIFLSSGTASGLRRAAARDGGFEPGEVRDAGDGFGLVTCCAAAELTPMMATTRMASSDDVRNLHELLPMNGPHHPMTDASAFATMPDSAGRRAGWR